MSQYRYPPGQAPTTWTPGDVLLTRSHGFVGEAIRFGQGLHYRSPDHKYCWTNHAALVVATDGSLVESLSHGPTVRNADQYKSRDYVVVDTELDADARAKAVAEARSLIGDEYGWIDIASISISLLTGRRIHLPHDKDSIICSAAVAVEMSAAGVTDIGQASAIDWVMPADLAKYWNVIPT